MIEISVVIPVYNSEGCLFELDNKLRDALSDMPHEIILINDQSKDKSWEKIVEISKENKKVTAINLRKNVGQDNAIMAGLQQAKGEYIVIMDDDLQHSPYDIKKLYSQCKSGNYDVCFGNFLEKQNVLWKRWGSWFNGKVAEILLSKPKDIYLSPFKIVKNEVINEIIKYDGPFPYVDGLILTITNNFTKINLGQHKRFSGKGNYDLIRSLKVFMKLATSFSVMPLRIASFLGFITSLIGFFLGCYYIMYYFLTKNNIEGWTTLVVIILFLGGVMLLSLGIIGEYLGRAYVRFNNIPQYTIKEIIKSAKNI